MAEFKDRLKELREQKGFTQVQLSEALGMPICYSKNAEYTAFVANRIFKMQMKMQMEKPYGLCTHTALLLFFCFF